VYGEGEDSFAAYVGQVLRDRSLTIALAESCTGGLAGQLLTSVPGSSEYVLLDAVTYSNASKIQLLGVHAELIRAYGAVSSEVAAEMAEGALRISSAHLAVSITGIAGPGGGTDDKPVGTVWVGLARRAGKTETRHLKLGGSRDRIRDDRRVLGPALARRRSAGSALTRPWPGLASIASRVSRATGVASGPRSPRASGTRKSWT
jgi:nicotinamide-nucleotide amidase